MPLRAAGTRVIVEQIAAVHVLCRAPCVVQRKGVPRASRGSVGTADGWLRVAP